MRRVVVTLRCMCRLDKQYKGGIYIDRNIHVMAYGMLQWYTARRGMTSYPRTPTGEGGWLSSVVCVFPERIITPNLFYTTSQLRIGAFAVNATTIVE